MFKFNIISQNLNIDFLKFKFFALLFSLILIVITFSSLFLNGLNLGIDFSFEVLKIKLLISLILEEMLNHWV